MTIHSPSFQVDRPAFLSGGQWALDNLNHITVIFGKNGSGKSILLRSIRDLDKAGSHYVCPERTGDIGFAASYQEQQSDGAGRADNSRTNFIPDYRQRVIARIQVFLGARGNVREASIPVSPDELEAQINSLLTDFSLRIRHTNPPYELVRNGQNVTTVANLSSGEAEALLIALDAITICAIWKLEGRSKRILLLDEPDTHLHPDLQQKIAKFIVGLSSLFDAQILIATHSTTMLSALGFYGGEHTSILYLNNSVQEQRAHKFDSALKELAACLGGHVLMGPLFGAPILLVEGDDDFKIWAQVPRHHVVNLAVIPCNGEEIYQYQKTLEKVLGSILNPGPFGYALLDGDKPIPQVTTENQQQFVRFLKLNCHESENLYLTDEVLGEFGLTWDQAKAKLLEKRATAGQKAPLLESVQSWDRKTHDVKSIIIEIARIVDEKNVPWQTRVGKKIGKSKPQGQLKEFLGDTVVNALWP